MILCKLLQVMLDRGLAVVQNHVEDVAKGMLHQHVELRQVNHSFEDFL